MKKQKELQLSSIHDIFLIHNTELELRIYDQIKKLNQEHNNNILEAQLSLLAEICEDKKLNFNECKQKYINKKNIVDSKPNKVNEEILTKIIINNNVYYYDNKENGNVYNVSSKIVGILNNNKIIIH